jgi:hypothetical protein
MTIWHVDPNIQWTHPRSQRPAASLLGACSLLHGRSLRQRLSTFSSKAARPADSSPSGPGLLTYGVSESRSVSLSLSLVSQFITLAAKAKLPPKSKVPNCPSAVQGCRHPPPSGADPVSAIHQASSEYGTGLPSSEHWGPSSTEQPSSDQRAATIEQPSRESSLVN